MDIAVLVGLFVFAVVYNWLVGWLERKGRTMDCMGLIVSGGCFVVLIGLWIRTNKSVFLIALECFAAAGVPMIAGQIHRYQNLRRRVDDTAKETAKHFFTSSPGGQVWIDENSGEPSTNARLPEP